MLKLYTAPQIFTWKFVLGYLPFFFRQELLCPLVQEQCLVGRLAANLPITGCNFTVWTPWLLRLSSWSGGRRNHWAKSSSLLCGNSEWNSVSSVSSRSFVMVTADSSLFMLSTFYCCFAGSLLFIQSHKINTNVCLKLCRRRNGVADFFLTCMWECVSIGFFSPTKSSSNSR